MVFMCVGSWFNDMFTLMGKYIFPGGDHIPIGMWSPPATDVTPALCGLSYCVITDGQRFYGA
jgi:hypothetical protein